MQAQQGLRVLVRGSGDVGSAVAHCLLGAGYTVVLHDQPQPTTTRRGMAFTDAIFDGQTALAQYRLNKERRRPWHTDGC